MATMNQLMTALRAADAAGNTQDAKRIAQIIQGMQQPQKTDSALGFSLDQAQKMMGKGVQVVGDLTGSETLQQYGKDVVAQQEKDIAEGGYKSTYGNSLTSYIGTDNFFPASGEKVVENLVSGGVAIGGTGAAAVASIMGAPITALGLGAATLGGSMLMATGSSAEDQEAKTGDYDPATAATVGVISGILDKVGAGKVIPKNKLAGMTVGDVANELTKKGYAKQAVDFTADIVKAARGEALTETAQTGVEIAGTAAQGGDFTAQEIVERGGDALMLGGTMGGAARGGIGVVSGVGSGLNNIAGGSMVVEDAQAATNLANRIQSIADRDGINLRNVTNNMDTKGARSALDQAHKEIVSQLNERMADIRKELKANDADSDQVKADKEAVRRAREQARNKTKNFVGNAELEAVERLLGGTAEGQRLLALLRESNELTRLHNMGMVGGISQYSDSLNPFYNAQGYSVSSALQAPIRAGITGAGAVATGGLSLIPQGAAFLGGRALDRATGRRSNVERFVRMNRGEGGIQQIDAPSLIKSRALEKAQREEEKAQRRVAKRATQQAAFERGDPPNPNSPQGKLEEATGLDQQGILVILPQIAAANPSLERSVRQMKVSMREGDQRIDDLGGLITAARGLVDRYPALADIRVREPVNQSTTQQQTTVDQRREQGKKDNQAFIDDLRQQVNDSNGISPVDKAVLNAALLEMRLDLGLNPIDAALDIASRAQDSLEKPQLADKYLLPYVERVERQQKKRN